MTSNRKPIPQSEVVKWLLEKFPNFQFELDRKWVWITTDLRQDEPSRQALKAFGFVFAKNGGHKLPSGAMGTWGHSCDAPLPFRKFPRRRGAAGKSPPAPPTPQPTPEVEATEDDDAEALAFAMGANL